MEATLSIQNRSPKTQGTLLQCVNMKWVRTVFLNNEWVSMPQHKREEEKAIH